MLNHDMSYLALSYAALVCSDKGMAKRTDTGEDLPAPFRSSSPIQSMHVIQLHRSSIFYVMKEACDRGARPGPFVALERHAEVALADLLDLAEPHLVQDLPQLYLGTASMQRMPNTQICVEMRARPSGESYVLRACLQLQGQGGLAGGIDAAVLVPHVAVQSWIPSGRHITHR